MFSYHNAVIVARPEGDEAYDLYGCEYCDQEFTNTTELVEHHVTHPEVQETKYIDDSS